MILYTQTSYMRHPHIIKNSWIIISPSVSHPIPRAASHTVLRQCARVARWLQQVGPQFQHNPTECVGSHVTKDHYINYTSSMTTGHKHVTFKSGLLPALSPRDLSLIYDLIVIGHQVCLSLRLLICPNRRVVPWTRALLPHAACTVWVLHGMRRPRAVEQQRSACLQDVGVRCRAGDVTRHSRVHTWVIYTCIFNWLLTFFVMSLIACKCTLYK